jgi:hypothetical protein
VAGVCDVVAEEFVVSVLVELVLDAGAWFASVDGVVLDGAVLGVADWLLVSVDGVVLDGALELVAPVWALSLVAVPVVEVAGAVLLCGVVSGVCGVVAGAVPVWVELEVGAAVVDEVWSVTGG